MTLLDHGILNDTLNIPPPESEPGFEANINQECFHSLAPFNMWLALLVSSLFLVGGKIMDITGCMGLHLSE
jgi:hypothetical protein